MNSKPTARFLIDRFDWATTSLGPMSKWSAPIRSIVETILHARTPMALLCGCAATLIYNDAFAARIGARHPASFGMAADRAFPDHAAFNRGAFDCIFAGESLVVHDAPITLSRPNHADQPRLDCAISPVSNETGIIIGAMAILTEPAGKDRTGAEAETALRQAQKMEAVGQLTGAIAHDFNNLLTGIIGNLDMLASRLAQGRYEAAESYLDGARSAASRAAGLTHRLLTCSGRQTLVPELIPIPALLDDMEDLIRETVGASIAVTTRCEANLHAAFCDPNLLETALLNLAINARDAMQHGGRFTIEATSVVLDRATKPQDCAPGAYIALTVTDTGTGMDEASKLRAFDPFFTTKSAGQGTGLGLSMVYGFVRQSGGYLELHSNQGTGTTVRLLLPQKQQVHQQDEPFLEGHALAQDAPIARPGETVLIVDDEPDLRALLADMLADVGFTVIEAGTAETALPVIRSNTRLDLLITDIGLAGSMDGRRFAGEARRNRPDLPILFVTGFVDDGDQANPLTQCDLLAKPFSFDTLRERIAALLDRLPVS